MYKYYQKTFTQIPTMIVDEADIVTYTKDEDGNDVKHIEFDQYVYYNAVRCNRQEIGKISDWQDGVESYKKWGCCDTAWSFNNKKNGVYFFWNADENAFAADAASAFSGGQLALAGIGGLILGILGSTLVLNRKRRKDEPEAA